MEKSTFIEVFGDSPSTRVLDFLLTFNEFDYSIKQIAGEIEAGWTTVEEIIRALLKKRIVKETREVGKAKMYMLDKANPTVKVLLKVDLDLAKAAAKELEEIPARTK